MLETLKQSLQEIVMQTREVLQRVETSKDLEALRVLVFGRKGDLTSIMSKLPELPPQERPELGKAANSAKQALLDLFTKKEKELVLREIEQRLHTEVLDVTLPGNPPRYGHVHPVSQVMDEIKDIFVSMGFDIATGPDIETDYNNFEALNIPRDHPARDMQDTFYVNDEILLRTHTSPVQIRAMLQQKPPLASIMPGKVYRCDADISHSPMFHQVEGLMVDRDIKFSDLKGVLKTFAQAIFGKGTQIRFRPSYFPFTEPSAEVDIQCVICKGVGCRVCGDSGWLEVVGSGMVHPKVFLNVNYDPKQYTGFAFGMGVERIAMLKFGINDIRLFFENDLRFLKQF
jgi:phenylalanyl-tRNA synthetase alpha chain